MTVPSMRGVAQDYDDKYRVTWGDCIERDQLRLVQKVAVVTQSYS